LKTNLDTIKTIKELNDKWLQNKKAYEANENKEAIIELYAIRKSQLKIEAIREKLETANLHCSVGDIDQYLETAIDSDSTESLIAESLAGNKDAIKQLATQIINFLEIQDKAEKAKQELVEKGKEPSQGLEN